MNTTTTFVLGAAEALYGLVGLITGWVDSATAVTLIVTGVSVFGLTHQNKKLGAA